MEKLILFLLILKIVGLVSAITINHISFSTRDFSKYLIIGSVVTLQFADGKNAQIILKALPKLERPLFTLKVEKGKFCGLNTSVFKQSADKLVLFFENSNFKENIVGVYEIEDRYVQEIKCSNFLSNARLDISFRESIDIESQFLNDKLILAMDVGQVQYMAMLKEWEVIKEREKEALGREDKRKELEKSLEKAMSEGDYKRAMMVLDEMERLYMGTVGTVEDLRKKVQEVIKEEKHKEIQESFIDIETQIARGEYDSALLALSSLEERFGQQESERIEGYRKKIYIAKKQQDVERFYKTADSLQKEGKYKEATKVLEELISKYPDEKPKADDKIKTLRALEWEKEFEKEKGIILANIQNLKKERKYKEATEYILEVEKKYPQLKEVLDKEKKSIEYILTEEQFDKEFKGALELKEKKEYTKALKQLASLKDRFPDKVRIISPKEKEISDLIQKDIEEYYKKAQDNTKAGKYEDAISQLKELVSIYPQEANKAKEFMQKISEAKQKKEIELCYVKVSELIREERYDEAISKLRELVNTYPQEKAHAEVLMDEIRRMSREKAATTPAVSSPKEKEPVATTTARVPERRHEVTLKALYDEVNKLISEERYSEALEVLKYIKERYPEEKKKVEKLEKTIKDKIKEKEGEKVKAKKKEEKKQEPQYKEDVFDFYREILDKMRD